MLEQKDFDRLATAVVENLIHLLTTGTSKERLAVAKYIVEITR